MGYQHQQSRQELEQQTLLTTRALVQAVDNHLLKTQAAAVALSTSESLRQGNLAAFHREASQAMRLLGRDGNLVLRDVAGRQVLNTAAAFGTPLTVQPEPLQVQGVFESGQPTISNLFIGPLRKLPLMSVDVPVVVEGQVIYALGISILPQQFNELMASQKLPSEWITAVLDQTGVFVARSRQHDIYVGQRGSQSLLRQLDQSREGVGEAVTLEGAEVMAFHSRSSLTDWTVAIGVPRESFTQGLYQATESLATSMIFLFGSGALLAWLIGGRIARAFQGLSAQAGAMGNGGKGRFTAPPLPRLKEAAEVSAVLTQTAAILDEREAKLLASEARFKAIAQDLHEADVRKDEFIAVLAHELRNPLAPVRTAVEILQRVGPQEPRLTRAYKVIERQVTHMARLIDDLLDIARIAGGKLALQPVTCDLATVARETAEDYQPSMDSAGLSFGIYISSAPIWVQGDGVRLSQMIGNLLNNAARFTKQGGQVEVRVESDIGLDEAVVQVVDTGIGIPAELQQRLFAPFSQGTQDLARSKGGLGLGLALTKGFVELHGGSLHVQSGGDGLGATFTLRFPLSSAPPATAPTLAPSASVHLPRRVLVIEDNQDAGRTLCELLELMGHQVELALDGETGIAAAHRLAPDVVISDIGLPGKVDGFEVARQISAAEELRNVVLIALSGYTDEKSRFSARESGFQHYLFKPVNVDELEQVIASEGSTAIQARPTI